MLQGRYGRGQVRTFQQNVDILSVAHRGHIDGCDPGGHGVPTYHCVREPGRIKGRAYLKEPFSNQFHGQDHPIENRLLAILPQLVIDTATQRVAGARDMLDQIDLGHNPTGALLGVHHQYRRAPVQQHLVD